MVKDHSDIERGNPLPPHGLLFPINSKGSFICTIPRPLWSTGWNEKYSVRVTNHHNIMFTVFYYLLQLLVIKFEPHEQY